MKKEMMVYLFIIIAITGMIRWNDPVISGQELEMHINVVNDNDADLDDNHVNVLIYDLGIELVTNTFDIDGDEKVGKWIFWDTKGVEPGTYLSRIVVSNDDFREVTHRYITIA